MKEAFVGCMAVTIGLANKVYGGPEEGGWWFDTFEPARVFYFRTKNAPRHMARLGRLCDAMNKAERRAPPSSMACVGYWEVWTGAITKDQPEERPHYE